MGLSERKIKQKIGADPRNLTWADSAAKFGHTYLAKHGWNPTMGLGVAGDGRVSHIAVAQKLDQLGIGAGRPDGPDAIAWKQAKEFEGLLERLNAAGASGGPGEQVEVEVTETVEVVEGEKAGEEEDKAKRKEKRREEKRKAKEAKTGTTEAIAAEEAKPVVAPAPRRLAHRARFLAAKRLAGTSSTALSEILGVASTPTSASTPSTPSGSTPAPASLTLIPVLDNANQITTSSQSVADYFRDKMRARAAQTQASAAPSTTSTPVIVFEEPEIDVPRAGLGSSKRDSSENEEKDDDETARPKGLGFSGTGLGFKRAASPLPPTSPATDSPLPLDEISSNCRESKKEKKRKRKEAEQAAATAGSTSATPTESDPESDRKAAKRARKEARRAARQQKEESAGAVTETSDRPKKKRKADE